MDLFRPFMAKGQRLSTFSTSPRRPEAIFALAMAHLRALTRDYCIRYAGLPESHTISWVHGPLYVAPAILHYDRSEGWQSEFLYYIEVCVDLLHSHAVLDGFVRALLGMAVDTGVFSLNEATLYLEDLYALSNKRSRSADLEAGFIVDQDLAVEDHTIATVDAVAQRFNEMLFQENPMRYSFIEM